MGCIRSKLCERSVFICLLMYLDTFLTRGRLSFSSWLLHWLKRLFINDWIQFYGMGYIQKPPFIFMQTEQNVLHQPWTKYKE